MLCFLPLQFCKLLEDRPQASVLIDQNGDDVVEKDECVQKRQAKLQEVRPHSSTGGDLEVLGVQGVCKLCEAAYSPSRIHTSILHHRSAWAMCKHHVLSMPMHACIGFDMTSLASPYVHACTYGVCLPHVGGPKHTWTHTCTPQSTRYRCASCSHILEQCISRPDSAQADRTGDETIEHV